MKTRIYSKRYRKLIWFFARIFVHVIWWDLFLRRVPILQQRARSSSIQRWRKIARRFRGVAIEMGGVLIKLGQFLSIRVDVLPVEVISELADLQDEVPAEDFGRVQVLIEADFGKKLAQIFGSFDETPLAAASLAQAHRATLLNGQSVVVKVQRPGIDKLVQTDLAAIGLAIKWLKLYPRISRHVNLDRLAEEFITVTQRELDFVAEGHNAEQFAADFADNDAVYVPQVYWDYSTARVLTLEDVAFIRISDSSAMQAAGIDPAEVAKTLYAIYMTQVFVTFFVHADPHPGNLFVRPILHTDELSATGSTSFQIVFVDFGMVASVPERLRHALRNYAIGVGTRDVPLIIQSYVEANVLLPGADLKRLEEAHQMVFDRFWGAGMAQMKDLAMSEAPHLMREYQDLIYEAPFQFQVDMLFVVRAIGLLSGISTSLDKNFDPWAETMPFAEKLAKEQLKNTVKDWRQDLLTFGRIGVGLLPKVDRVLTQAQRGTLSVETSWSPQDRKRIKQIEHSVGRLMWAVVSMGTLISGVILRGAEGANSANNAMLVAAGVIFVWKVVR